MTQDAEFLAIQEDIEYRFRPANPIAKAISEKLCLTLYKQRHCEHWIDKAQSLPPQCVNALSPEDRLQLHTRLGQMRDKLRVLRRRAKNYCVSLVANEPTESEN